MELADTSAWSTSHRDRALSEAFEASVRRGAIATCDVVRAELLRSARDHHGFVELREELAALPDVPIRARVWNRAFDVFEELARSGPLHHRQVPFLDLLVAASAEQAELTVLHYDRHFELIAEVTGQPVRAMAPLGSL